jgi:hypothetical protein
MSKRRLRILDISTPWFFAVIFFRRQTGRGISFELSAYDRRGTREAWSLDAWKWEPEPDQRPQQAVPEPANV